MGRDLIEFEEPADTKEEILVATYEALAKHGYAELTIAKIGDEFEKAPSVIYHHYDDKEALVLDCLEFLLERFEASLTGGPEEAPDVALRRFVDETFEAITDEPARLVTTLVELRVRATHDDFHEHFTRSDRLFHDHLVAIVRRGVDDGTFADCDPDRVAALLLTTLTGALYRATTSDAEAALEATRTELYAYLEARLELARDSEPSA